MKKLLYPFQPASGSLSGHTIASAPKMRLIVARISPILAAFCIYMQLGIEAQNGLKPLTPTQLIEYAGSKIPLITDDPSTWSAQRQACHNITLGKSGDGVSALYGGFVPWAPGSAWTTNISRDPIDPNSATWMARMDGGNGIAVRGPIPTGVSDNWGVVHYGIPLVVVDSSTPKVPVNQDLGHVPAIAAIDPSAEPNTSDVGPIPVPLPPSIQETTGPGTAVNYMVAGDKHTFTIDRDSCFEYETWNTYWYNGQLYAGTVAVFDLLGGDMQRPYGWTSTSVSGVPQYAGSVSADEVLSGHINHALAFTAFWAWGRAAFTAPATSHQWNMPDVPAQPPFGARMRLKQSFLIDPNLYGPQARVVLQALKDYGAVYVDGGQYGDMYWDVDSRWNWNDFANFWHIAILNNFDFVQAGPIYSYKPSGADTLPPAGPAPTIVSLEVYPARVKAGSPVIVFWSSTGDDMRFLSSAGPTRKNFAILTPTATTTYTLSAQNKYGRTTQTVTVTVTP
jgi:hypothetical protein